MNNSSWEEQEAARLFGIAHDIRVRYIWVIFVLGFPTNLLSVATVLSMRTLTAAIFYVATLALCDALTLLAKLVGHQMSINEAYFGSVGCKADFIAGYISTLANWILVFICAERCVSVCFPLKKHIIFTKHRAYISTLVLVILFLVIYAVLFAVMRDSTPDGLLCGTLDEYVEFWTKGWYWINVCIHLFFPLPIIIVLTVLIICGISRSRRDRRSILHNGNGYDDGNSRLLKEIERLEKTITVMLVVAAIVFTVLTLPACIYILADDQKPKSNVLSEARWRLFDQIQYVFVDSSHAVNFFLYFFSSKKFRDQFFFLVTCKKWPKHLRKATGTSSMTYTTKYTVAKSNDDVSHI